MPHVLLDLRTNAIVLGLPVTAHEARDHAVERRLIRSRGPLPFPGELDFFSRPVKDRFLHFRGQSFPRSIQLESQMPGQGFQHQAIPAGLRVPPRMDRAALNGKRGVRNDQGRVDGHPAAEPIAFRTRAERTVEGEKARSDFSERRSALDAGELLGEHDVGLALDLQHDRSLAGASRGRQRIGNARANPLFHHETIDDDLDRVLALLVQSRDPFDVHDLAVDAHPNETFLARVAKHALVLAFARAHERRQHLHLRPFAERQHAIGHLIDRLRLDGLVAVRAVRFPDPRVEQSQIVVDLGDRTDRRARIAGGALLLDGNRRREPLDRIDVGLVHLTQELARIRGQTLHVAPLPFRVDRVEGERRFPRAGKPGEDNETIARKRDVQILEVVLPRAADANHRARQFFLVRVLGVSVPSQKSRDLHRTFEMGHRSKGNGNARRKRQERKVRVTEPTSRI